VRCLLGIVTSGEYLGCGIIVEKSVMFGTGVRGFLLWGHCGCSWDVGKKGMFNILVISQ